MWSDHFFYRHFCYNMVIFHLSSAETEVLVKWLSLFDEFFSSFSTRLSTRHFTAICIFLFLRRQRKRKYWSNSVTIWRFFFSSFSTRHLFLQYVFCFFFVVSGNGSIGRMTVTIWRVFSLHFLLVIFDTICLAPKSNFAFSSSSAETEVLVEWLSLFDEFFSAELDETRPTLGPATLCFKLSFCLIAWDSNESLKVG